MIEQIDLDDVDLILNIHLDQRVVVQIENGRVELECVIKDKLSYEGT